MREWQVRRGLQPHPDGQRRWDRAYQQRMAWTDHKVSRPRPASSLPHGR